MASIPLPARSGPKVDYRSLLYFGLRSAGFIAGTLLMTWGVFALFFLTIGGFSLDGMMHHLGNMTSRYLAADSDRVNQFKLIVGVTHMVIFAAIMFFRRHAIFPRDAFRRELGA